MRAHFTCINNKSSFFLLTFIVSFFCFRGLNAQNLHRITHLRGSRTINGINVKVTSTGKVDSIYYCGDDKGPYYAGYNSKNTGCATGAYTFTFSQPVKEISLNFSALSNSTSYDEEVEIHVNGAHYKITTIGVSNNCESLSVITQNGNLKGCSNCTGSGTNGIKIKGPINTLTVYGKINLGEPMGIVFGLFMGDKITEPVIDVITNTLVNYTLKIEENAAGTDLIIESEKLQNAEISLKDLKGQKVTLIYKTIKPTQIIINTSELIKGEYLLEISLNGKTEKQRIIID